MCSPRILASESVRIRVTFLQKMDSKPRKLRRNDTKIHIFSITTAPLVSTIEMLQNLPHPLDRNKKPQ